MTQRIQVIAALVTPALLANISQHAPHEVSFDLFAAPTSRTINVDDIVRIDDMRIGTTAVIYRTPSKPDAPLLVASAAVLGK